MTLDLILAVFLADMSFTDYKYGKIRNNAVIAGILTAAVMRLTAGGDALADGLAGGVTGLLTGFLFWKLHIFRAGDAKMLWMIGNFSGFSGFLSYFAAVIVMNGLIALVLMIAKGVLKERLYGIFLYFKGMVMLRTAYAYPVLKDDPVRLPMAPGAFAGVFLLLVMKAAGITVN